jgi:hypothetical protein
MLLPLLVRYVPLLCQLLYHLFVHVPVQWRPLNLPVFMHILLQVCVQTLYLCRLEKAYYFQILSHEYLLLPR